MTFKGLLNKKSHQTFKSTAATTTTAATKKKTTTTTKAKKRELRQSTETETVKLAATGKPIYKSHFLKYARTLYKQIQEPKDYYYCDVILSILCLIETIP